RRMLACSASRAVSPTSCSGDPSSPVASAPHWAKYDACLRRRSASPRSWSLSTAYSRIVSSIWYRVVGTARVGDDQRLRNEPLEEWHDVFGGQRALCHRLHRGQAEP